MNYSICSILPAETQHVRLDCKARSDKERAVGYPIPCSLCKYIKKMMYDIRRAVMEFLQKKRDHTYVLYGFYD